MKATNEDTSPIHTHIIESGSLVTMDKSVFNRLLSIGERGDFFGLHSVIGDRGLLSATGVGVRGLFPGAGDKRISGIWCSSQQ